MTIRKAGRLALVTGGMGGIGTAICRRLGGAGMRVAAGCLPAYPQRDAWLEKMRGEGLDVLAAEGSVDDFASCAAML